MYTEEREEVVQAVPATFVVGRSKTVWHKMHVAKILPSNKDSAENN